MVIKIFGAERSPKGKTVLIYTCPFIELLTVAYHPGGPGLADKQTLSILANNAPFPSSLAMIATLSTVMYDNEHRFGSMPSFALASDEYGKSVIIRHFTTLCHLGIMPTWLTCHIVSAPIGPMILLMATSLLMYFSIT